MKTQQNPADPMLARLTETLEIHGGDVERWPEARRGELQALLVRSPEARSLQAEAVALDRLLAAAPATTATAHLELMARIQRSAHAPVAQPVTRGRPLDRSGWAIAASLAACVALGVYLGSLSTVGSWIDPVFGTQQEFTEVLDGELGLEPEDDV